MDFIAECEARWKTQSATLTEAQTAWLTWAKQIAQTLSPFSTGYPDPTIDGAFDPTTIPFGGPYPPPRAI